MSDRRAQLIGAARDALSSELYRLGHTPKSLEETQRDVLWWTYARVQAALNLRPALIGGWGIAWTSAGYAELVPVEVPRAGRDHVTIEVDCSAVSRGTERAQYLKLPNAQVGVLGRPGYSASGTVIGAGGGSFARRFKPGDLVAVTGAAHASVINVPARQVFAVPPGVRLEEAALVMLGTICLHGAELAAARSEQRVAVVGAGPIGALAFRIACQTAEPAAVIAASARHAAAAAASGARFISLADEEGAVAEVGADVVIEATGNPDAIGAAIAAAAPGARVVLLGSSRGLTRALPVMEIRAKGLRLIGAHVDTLDLKSAQTGRDERRSAGERFLGLLASGSLAVSDLLGEPVDPRGAAAFYRELAQGPEPAGGYFDWRLLGADRLRRSHLAGVPNVRGRGMEAKLPERPRRRRPGVFELEDPFAGAAGRLRLGVIGCGDIAVHNAAGAAAAPNVEITACFDPARRLAEDLATRHGAAVASSQDELLSRDDVDAVLVCVPHDLHASIAIAACAAGKHVVVEKPLANNLTEAGRIQAAAHEHGVWVSVCFPQRYGASVQIARRLIAEGAIGTLTGTLIRLFLDKSPAYWLGGFSARAQSDWRRSKERAGGGVLIMNLSHHLDLVGYLCGHGVAAVSAFTEPAGGIEDAVVATLRYEGGALGSLLGSAAVRGSTEEELSLWGSEGRVIIEPSPRVYTLHSVAGLRTTRWHSFGRLPALPIRAIYLSRLATALSEGRSPDVTLKDGIAVQSTIEAIYRSAAAEASIIDPRTLAAEEAMSAK